MLHSLLPEKHIQGNRLESHLRTYAASLLESGYRNTAIHEKLYCSALLGGGSDEASAQFPNLISTS